MSKMTDQIVVQMLVNGQNDLTWFESNLVSLKSKFNNKFIAFRNKEVIDSDPNLDNLINRLNNNNTDISNIFIEFVSKIKTIL